MTKGAKGMFASFWIYIQLIWSAKAVLIVLFMRLTYVHHGSHWLDIALKAIIY